MNAIVAAALRFRAIVVGLAFLLLIVGARTLPSAPLDVFPEFAPPIVEIQTEAPGLSTEDVERLVSIPIENAVNGTAWMTGIRSKSVLGLSSVVVLFERGVDLMAARQLVQERVSHAARDLPAAARPPVLLSPLSSTSRVLKIGLSSEALSQIDLSAVARWKIRPRLMAVPGVANVAIWGQRDRQLQVLFDPDRLAAVGVTLDEVFRAARDAVSVGAGGFVDTPSQRLAVAFDPAIVDAGDLANAVVAQRGASTIRLRDVADVVEGAGAPIGDGIVNDVPGVLLIVEKQPWGNTLSVTRAVDAALADLAPALEGIDVDAAIFRPATFIEMSLANLRSAMGIGAVFVALVLGAFLYDWRTVVISLFAMPLSLVAAALAMANRGASIDTMVLAGLVIALGEVVDDAIIDVENILRRLRQERAKASPRSDFRVVLEASIEVRSAVVYATFIIAVVLVPVFLLPGLAGAFFRPLALAYILAILASLGVALTVTPALCLLLLPRAKSDEREPPLVVVLKRRYASLLPHFLDARRAAFVVGGASAAALAVWPLLGQEFLPSFREYDFLMHWVTKEATSIEAMDRITIRASKELRAVPGVRNFGAHVGRAEVADEVVGPNFTELWISLDPEVDYDATVEVLQEVVDGYPGLYRDLLTYLRERVKEVLTGASATIVVRIFGDDMDALRATAERVRGAMEGVEGVAHLAVEQQTLVPQIGVRIRPGDAQLHGLTAGAIQNAVELALRGQRAGQLFPGQEVVDVVVWGAPSLRGDPVALAKLRIPRPEGGSVALRDVAHVDIRPAPNTIKRDGASRRIDVTCNVDGRSLGDVARDVEDAVRALSFPRGVHPEFLGEYAEASAAQTRLGLASLLALAAVFALLHADFRSLRLALLVFASLPFALVGGVVAVLLSGGVVSLGSLVGFVTVFGIAARNALMLVSHALHLEREEGMTFGSALVERAAHERLSPILMTALTTGLALVPIALGGARPGTEIEHPMALVILGGLATSTGLNLFLMPALYLRYGGARAAVADGEER